MNGLKISGAQFRDMVYAGAALLEKNKQTIDALNVFPVPDGDTGTNMSMTMQSAVRELRGLPVTASISEVADALSTGALRGARGNSGVILSQLFRGFSRACKGETFLDAELLSRALTMGSEAAYKAVMKPKEGTILTVSRRIAEHVAEYKDKGANVFRLFDAIVDEGERALLDTPNQLPVLKEAGVVDSGGKGLVTIYRGFKLSLDGEEIADYVEPDAEESAPHAADSFSGENIIYGYCTEFFIVHLNPAFSESDVDLFRAHLEKLGDSVVVASDSDMVKVHVHSNSPGKVLQMALRLGELDNLKIENMREQNRKLQEERKRAEKEQAFISVSAGDGLDTVFRELSADHIIPGGQTMNPSIDTIVQAINRVNARNVFILPNNGNIIMAAQQAAQLTERKVFVIPTKTIPQGIAAAMAYSVDASPDENSASMTAAFESVLSGAVTYAVRNTKVNGSDIHKGDIIGLMDNQICVVAHSVEEAGAALVRRMMEKRQVSDATVTVFYGADVDEESAEALVAKLTREYADAELIMQRGGQPLYYYFFSVE